MNLGILADILTDALCDTAAQLNKMGIDTVLFVNNWGQITHMDVSIMCSANIWGFRHPVVAVDGVAARILAECPVPTKRILYTQDYAWNRFTFEDNMKIYNDPASLILVSNTYDRDIFASTFHKNVQIVPDLDPEELAKCLKN